MGRPVRAGVTAHTTARDTRLLEQTDASPGWETHVTCLLERLRYVEDAVRGSGRRRVEGRLRVGDGQTVRRGWY